MGKKGEKRDLVRANAFVKGGREGGREVKTRMFFSYYLRFQSP